jgi:hypothetical protein
MESGFGRKGSEESVEGGYDDWYRIRLTGSGLSSGIQN